MTDTTNYPVTDSIRTVINGVHLIHETSNTDKGFMHRLCAGGSLGDWVPYEWFATADYNGRVFMACQDNWQPLFPNIFEVVS